MPPLMKARFFNLKRKQSCVGQTVLSAKIENLNIKNTIKHAQHLNAYERLFSLKSRKPSWAQGGFPQPNGRP